jgi:predicted AlkP superfamily pyrophosphatase or phosphodiesterase
MNQPNYKDGSIVNLMSSIISASGGKSSYGPLKLLKPQELGEHKNIVLLVIDALGYEYLKKNGAGTLLKKHLRGKITSVMPSTTAAAITTFGTGLPPEEHCITGWHMYLKELGMIATPLRFRPRTGASCLDLLDPREVLDISSAFTGIKTKSYFVLPSDILHSKYNESAAGKEARLGYTTLQGLFRVISAAVNSSGRKKLIYAYWPEFDDICHSRGPKSKEAKNHLLQIDAALEKFLRSIDGTDTIVIITSDHGQIDTPLSKMIHLDSHPSLKDCLTLPLSGEPRFAYCYVRPSKAKEFERYIRKKLGHAFYLFRSEQLVKRHFFGKGKPDKRLYDRIGDYIS